MSSTIPWHPGESIRIAFLAQDSYGWPHWRSIWRACVEHPRVVPQVVLVPSRSWGSPLSPLDALRNRLLEEDVPFFDAAAYDLARMRPHVAFVAHPYDGTRPPSLRVPSLIEHGVRIAYVGYAMEIGGGLHNLRFQNEQELHQCAWRVFARTERHRRMIGRSCPSGNGHVVVTGHPKIDAMRALDRQHVEAPRAARIGGRRTVLWSPHFSLPDPPVWSTFDRIADGVLAAMEQRPDLYLIVRPHPGFFPARRRASAFGPGWEAELRARIDATENVELDEAPDPLDAFAAADALMSDAGSFLLEFLPTGRPILYLELPDGLGLNDDAPCVESYDRASSVDEVIAFLDRVRAGEDPRRHDRAAIVEEFAGPVDGRVGERICAHVVDAIERGDDGAPVMRGLDPLYEDVLRVRTQWTAALLPPVQNDLPTLVALKRLCEEAGPFVNVLDANCLDGRHLAVVAPHASHVDAIDASESLVQHTRAAMHAAGLVHVTVQRGTFEEFAEPRRYDLVLLFDTFSYLVDETQALRALDRLVHAVREGSRVWIRQSTARQAAVVSFGDQKLRLLPADELPRLLAARGFAWEDERILREAGERVDRLYCFVRGTGSAQSPLAATSTPWQRREADPALPSQEITVP